MTQRFEASDASGVSDAPDPARAIARYRDHAPGYDASARRTMWLRAKTIDMLRLRRGDRVLDVACGTGLSLPALRHAVGPKGEVVGIEISPDMIDLARGRVADAGWRNVHLVESSVALADIHGPFDAVLFHFTHDVLRSPDALARVFASARPGARIALAGMKYVPWFLAPLNLIVRFQARPYMTTFEGLAAPWDLTVPYLDRFDWRPALFGTAYFGWGQTPPAEGKSATNP